jgi:hypothetical protein
VSALGRFVFGAFTQRAGKCRLIAAHTAGLAVTLAVRYVVLALACPSHRVARRCRSAACSWFSSSRREAVHGPARGFDTKAAGECFHHGSSRSTPVVPLGRGGQHHPRIPDSQLNEEPGVVDRPEAAPSDQVHQSLLNRSGLACRIGDQRVFRSFRLVV